MTQPFLSIRGFNKSFDRFTAVEDVSLEIPQGEFLTFLGPSGSGKSTTLFSIAGLDTPSGGDILIQGRSILDVPPNKRNIGMVFQRYTLFPHLSVRENVAFPLRVRRRPEREIQSKVDAMLALVRLEAFADRLPAKLSGGQQQRVALARALAYDPPVLLMDEPLSALDKKLREDIQLEIRRIHQETGVTILYVTHDQEEALRLSDRIAVFNNGRIEQVGSGECLYRDPATRFVAGFIGDSNFLTARLTAEAGGQCTVVLPDGTAFAGARLHASGARDMTAAEIMVRPHAVRFADADASAWGLAVDIRDITFLGDTVSVLLETAWGQTLWARAPAGTVNGLACSTRTRVQWDPAACHVFPA